jgi:hypothetical protein
VRVRWCARARGEGCVRAHACVGMCADACMCAHVRARTRVRARSLWQRRVARNPFLANMGGLLEFLTNPDMKFKKKKARVPPGTASTLLPQPPAKQTPVMQRTPPPDPHRTAPRPGACTRMAHVRLTQCGPNGIPALVSAYLARAPCLLPLARSTPSRRTGRGPIAAQRPLTQATTVVSSPNVERLIRARPCRRAVGHRPHTHAFVRAVARAPAVPEVERRPRRFGLRARRCG